MTFTFRIPHDTSKLRGWRPFTLKRVRRLTRLVARYGVATGDLAWEGVRQIKRRQQTFRRRSAALAFRTLAQLSVRPFWRPPAKVSLPGRTVRPAFAPPKRPRSPGRGAPASNGPPGGDGQGESSEGEEEDPPPPPRARARGRGRSKPRKTRRFRAHPDSRVYRRRLQKLDAVAAALEGRGDGLFLTLTPLRPPSEVDRRLAAVPPEVAKAFANFAAKLKRAKATYVLAVATRASGRAFFPHGHAIVGGVSPEKLARWAAQAGLGLHVEALRNPRAAARYIARRGQKEHWDVVLGGRGFYANLGFVSSRNSQAKTEGPHPVDVPTGLEIAPGVRIVDPDTFLAALAQDLESRAPAVRAAAQHRLALLQRALSEGGPP